MQKVLIIEDRRENIVFIANNILKPMGYDVITARDGQTGLAKAQEETPDLIITDLKLPGLGGLEVLEQLNAQGINIPAIVMTFHGTEETAVRALRLGARDYLIKPFTFEEMQAAITRALTSSQPAKPAPSPAPPAPDAELQTKVKQLEQELTRVRHTLVAREKQMVQMQQVLSQQAQKIGANELKRPTPIPASEAETRVAQLEQELIQMRTVLANREKQLAHVQQQLSNYVKKIDLAEVAQRAAAWEEDNARLNEALAQTKEMLNEVTGRANILEEVVTAQRAQMSHYQAEAKRLADQLRNLSEAVRLLSQDLGQQVERLGILIPRQRKE